METMMLPGTGMEPAVTKKKRPPSYKSETRMPLTARGKRLGCSSEVWTEMKDLASSDREHLVAFDLDVRHRIIGGRRIVSIGCLTGVEAHPREVFKPAITNGAAAMIVCHNHPSGDPTPSREDIVLTKRLREVGDLVGITLLDHVVVATDGFVSLAERGWN